MRDLKLMKQIEQKNNKKKLIIKFIHPMVGVILLELLDIKQLKKYIE